MVQQLLLATDIWGYPHYIKKDDWDDHHTFPVWIPPQRWPSDAPASSRAWQMKDSPLRRDDVVGVACAPANFEVGRQSSTD